MKDATEFMNNYEKNIDRVVETFAHTEVLDSWSSIQGLWKFVKEVFGDSIEYDIISGETPAWRTTECLCRLANDGIENGKTVDMIDAIRVGKDNALLLLVKYR